MRLIALALVLAPFVWGSAARAEWGDYHLPECGNGLLEADEECDDNNLSDLDSCLSTCTYSKPVSLPDCDGFDPEVQFIDEASDFSEINKKAKRIFCVLPGNYGVDVKLEESGSASEPRVIRFFDPISGGSALPHPVRMPEASRAILRTLRVVSANHWVVAGLSFSVETGTAIAVVGISGASSGNVFHRLLIEGGGKGGGQARMQGEDPLADNFLQESVLRETEATDGVDNHCSTVRHGNRIVSNEIYDCAGDGVQISRESTGRVIIANNDVYQTEGFTESENAIAIKGTGLTSSADWIRIESNRIVGIGENEGGTGATKAAIDFSADENLKSYILIRDNFIDGGVSSFSTDDGSVPGGGGGSSHISLVGNVFFRPKSTALKLTDVLSQLEAYFNTIIWVPPIPSSPPTPGDYGNWIQFGGRAVDLDVRCNAIVEACGGAGSDDPCVDTATTGTGIVVNENSFLDAPEFWFPSDATSGNLLRDDAGPIDERTTLVVEWKRLTGPDYLTIPYGRIESLPLPVSCGLGAGFRDHIGVDDRIWRGAARAVPGLSAGAAVFLILTLGGLAWLFRRRAGAL